MHSTDSTLRISAIVLAAGMSRRMGLPKMTLPWGDTTVIGQVIRVLIASGIEDICVVTGGARRSVEAALEGYPVRTIYNQKYRQDQMALSLKCGIKALDVHTNSVLVALGDQPQVERKTVIRLIQAAERSQANLFIPSHNMRRGHPWYLPRRYWPLVQQLQPPETLRDFLNRHRDDVYYINVNRASILLDLDTPEDYLHHKPE